MELNTTSRPGYINRHVDGLPKKERIIKIVYNDIDGEHIFLCKWHPFDPTNPPTDVEHDRAYLGTARTLDRKINIGFHAWQPNNYEFIYYQLVD